MTRRRSTYVTPAEIALLASIGRRGSVVAAALDAGLSRDQAVYHLRRLVRIAGGAVARAQRGGRAHGGTQLTPRGWALVRRGTDSISATGAPTRFSDRPAILSGTWSGRPYPSVRLLGGGAVAVAFRATEGEPVVVAIDPDAVLLARRRYPTSARNVVDAVVRRVRTGRGRAAGDRTRVELQAGSIRFAALVTARARTALRLAPGSEVVAYVKATAVRRVAPPATRGSLPS